MAPTEDEDEAEGAGLTEERSPARPPGQFFYRPTERGSGAAAALAEGTSPPRRTPEQEVERLDRVWADRSGPLQEGQTYYLVSSKWLSKWRRWVSQPSSASASRAPSEPRRQASFPSKTPSPPRRRQASPDALAARAGRRCASPGIGGLRDRERPGPIDNRALLEGGASERLRRGLDYECLPLEAWELLRSWYQGGPQVARLAERQASGDIQVDLGSCEDVDGSGPQGTPDSTDRDPGSLDAQGASTPSTLCGSSPINARHDASGRALALRTAGLMNLGNTCYMNSSIQCLGHIPEVRDHFLSGRFKDALVHNAKTTEKTGGKLAKEFADLLRRLWSPDARAFEPRTFKALVEQFSDVFRDRRQHDSMEFIEFLIDGLKEDVNNVKGKKPYVERSDANSRPDAVVALEASNGFLLRNDSEIDDLFVGFLKTVTTCPVDPSHESVVFDPFLSVKVPLASQTDTGEATFHVTSVPLAASGARLARWKVSVPKYDGVDDLIEAAAEAAGLRQERCALMKLVSGVDKQEDQTHRRLMKLDYNDKVEDVLEPQDVLFLHELPGARALQALVEKCRWGSEHVPRRGDIVVAVEDFMSNSKGRQLIFEGTLGQVIKVDADGDAMIRFDGLDSRQWVFTNNFCKLRVDLRYDLEERRSCVSEEDGPSMPCTLPELIEAEEDSSLEEVLSQWNAMRSVDEVPCWACVHFRRYDSRTGRTELFGVPAMVCVPRTVSVEDLAEAVRSELVGRYGPTVGLQWHLIQAGNWLGVANTRYVLWDEAERSACVEALPCPPEYLVVEWRDEAPEEIFRYGALAEPHEDATPEVTINRCFGWITEREQLSEQDSVYCSGCKEHRRMFRRVDFWSLPPVLVLQLKRFEFTGLSGRKDTTPVRFPLEGLDLREFCPSGAASFPSGYCLRAGRPATIQGLKSAASQQLNGQQGTIMYLDTSTTRFCVRLKEDDPSDQWKKIKPENLSPVVASSSSSSSEAAGPKAAELAGPPAIYDLVSVSKHVGCSSFGHYVAYARSCEDGLWRLFDDDDVTEVTAEEVESQRQGAYVLFYLRRDLRPESWGRAALPAEPPPAERAADSEWHSLD